LREEKKKLHPPNVLKLLFAELIAEIFVVGKPDYRQNFSISGKRNNLKDIGTIFIVLWLHWSNGYCTSLSSSDDG
jgi:hypothetical protein